MIPLSFSFFVIAFSALSAVCAFSALRIAHPPRRAACQKPSDLGLEAERVEFPARDGLLLRGYWVPAAHPRATLVLSHGYSGDCSPDLQYADWLTRAGYNLLYFDHRGHGMSDGDYTTLGAHETRDLIGALDWLAARGIHQVGAIGFSMGGSVVIQTAALTDAIRCVVVDSTFADLRTLLIPHAFRARVPRVLAPLAATLVVAFLSLRTRTNLFAHSPVNSIGRIAPRPVLIIAAGSDELVPASETERLYRAARMPKEIWRVPGALHRGVDRLAREEYERRITDFFDRNLAAGSMSQDRAPQKETSESRLASAVHGLPS